MLLLSILSSPVLPCLQLSSMIWQVPGEGELVWPSPPSFVLPSVPTPSTQPPPPYLGLPKDTGRGSSALTNRPVDYPALYTRTHQGPLPLTSFPSSLALNTATTVSETVHLTDLTQVKSCQLKKQGSYSGEKNCQPCSSSSALSSSSSSSHPTSSSSSLPSKATDAGLTNGLTMQQKWFYKSAQARFERDYMSLAECKQGKSDFKTGIANHHG